MSQAFRPVEQTRWRLTAITAITRQSIKDYVNRLAFCLMVSNYHLFCIRMMKFWGQPATVSRRACVLPIVFGSLFSNMLLTFILFRGASNVGAMLSIVKKTLISGIIKLMPLSWERLEIISICIDDLWLQIVQTTLMFTRVYCHKCFICIKFLRIQVTNRPTYKQTDQKKIGL